MIIAIVRLREHEPSDELIEALRMGGVTHAEVTLPTPGSLDLIKRWSEADAMLIGAGTVRDRQGAQSACDEGAQFLVCPTIDKDVLEIADHANIPVFPGALTPTEIETAYRHPAVEGVKVFPASALGGPDYIQALKAPMPDIPLVPTGGVGLSETRAYAQLGCAGVGVGSALVSEDAVARRDWGLITERASAFVEAWKAGLSGASGL
ncbi:bifunctional 4-hydroxy-2-oxoglutarate aldolase/2-dehydro-3-deoxy-phosphogluconate aldolase [Flaviflexus equikiangi]|uniref:Bifunctional 4-hydroxy-2-oxoglutarate aldolase/2-dehydro-3-deoxy-phosphogluconate aldolase n=1 Tax=Flaviflexus equikiangi TaxID=2758573 RepID=A0ABS2TG92_9ACTO|nr:bifunctional 4-hydroxy-2-oxoglutarate aldolase/2-dehydro-3-deoxy-phosphogluconate aldolase [Flaviflexus equikiangi]MBM9433647.1 bifunctional 4-hydroxy-2-oxoglutarate aldolase/2-dehydro-3-deoxy-phosphogluconate aldolase [Flaviflexus equikiangi]